MWRKSIFPQGVGILDDARTRAKEPYLAYTGRSSKRNCGVSHFDSKVTATGWPRNDSDSAAHCVRALLQSCRKNCKINTGSAPVALFARAIPESEPFPRPLCEIASLRKLHRPSYPSTSDFSNGLRLRDWGGVVDCQAASLQQLIPALRFRLALKRPNHRGKTALQGIVLSHGKERPAIYSLPPETGVLLRDAATASVRADWDTGMR